MDEVKAALLGGAATLLLVLMLFIAYHVGRSDIARECLRVGTFVVTQAVYECQERGDQIE